MFINKIKQKKLKKNNVLNQSLINLEIYFLNVFCK